MGDPVLEVQAAVGAEENVLDQRRLGLPEEMAAYYDEHVEADAVHEQLAVRSICGSLLAAEPALVEDVFLGAFSCLDLEDRVAHRVLGEWAA